MRTGVTVGRRWPLHPQPGPLEALSSWLRRLARIYHLSVKELLTGNLGLLDLADVTVPWDLDYDPPTAILVALAERTGVDLAQLQAMTLAGWRPWLFDTLALPRWEAQATFDTYVRQNSVLLAAGQAGTNDLARHPRWSGPWLPYRWLDRVCPVCAADPDRGTALVGRLPLMVGCVDHHCRLEDAETVALATPATRGNEPPGPRPVPVPVEEPLATMDRHTHQALTTGRVTLPGRSVHAGVWFRLLRALLDEVSLALTSRSRHGRTTLEQIWRATGRPERAGLRSWRPYEQLDWPTQEAMLHAAATALQLAADGQITARGVLGSAVQPPARQHVYDGDRPSLHPTRWQEVMAAVEAAVVQARTDRHAARQLLGLLTIGCRTRDRFEQQRAFLFGIGIPAEFLPSARELGRADLA